MFDAEEERDEHEGGRTDEERLSGLLGALRTENEWSTSYLRTELVSAQIDAMQRYMGDRYGDEQEGRSSVTTREVFETIEWLRPDLVRIFTSGERMCEFQATQPQAEAFAEVASDYVNFVMMEDNPGEQVIDQFVFDGLLHRVGIIACEWKDAEFSALETLEGLSTLQAQQIIADAKMGKLMLEDATQEAHYPCETHPDGMVWTMKVRPLESQAKAEIFCIAPEDFRIARRATELDPVRYCGDVVRMMRGEAKQLWPEFEEELEAANTDHTTEDERRAERFRDAEAWGEGQVSVGSEADEVEIMREFIRYDLDGDGYPELIKVYRVNDTILEHEEVSEHIYGSWAPIPVPHRFYGLSINDIAADIQRTKTVLLRSALDASYQAISPRIVYDKGADVDLDALLSVQAGVAIGVEGNPGDKIMPLVVPDLSQNAMSMMQWIDRVAESRTGVTRQAQGFDPDLLHDTAKGVELLQNAASIRKEQMARYLASGLSTFLDKVFRLLHRKQNAPRAVKIAGKWANIDPRSWDANLRCTVSTGLGTGAREKQLMMLQMLQADQVAAFQAFGPGNPVVTLRHMHGLVTEKMRVMGYKSADKFFGDPVDPKTGQDWQPPPPQDPNAAKNQLEAQKMQAQVQMEQMKLQSTMQLEQTKMQAEERQTLLQAQKDMEVAQAQQRDEMVRVELQAKSDQEKAIAERMRIELDIERLAFEREKAATEARIEMERLKLEGMKIAAQEAQVQSAHGFEREKMDRSEANERKKAMSGEELKQIAAYIAKPKKFTRGKSGQIEGFE